MLGAIWAAVMYEERTGTDVPFLPNATNGYVNDANNAIMDWGERFKKGLIDQWNQTGVGEVPTATWSNNGHGLQLEVLNALTSDWDPYFTQAMYNWAYGVSPTSLVLTLTNTTADPSCTSVDGVLKVCNSDYGETGWKGINECSINGLNQIVASVAKMNEFYLSSAGDGEKLYTMCHECGHGWGLGHQDENFYNLDLGTCMDYVLDPDNNQKPNARDFEILNQTYGYVSGRRERDRGLHLRWKGKPHTKKTESPQFISFTDSANRHRWRLLEKNPGMEIHGLDLGDGNRMMTRVMLAEH